MQHIPLVGALFRIRFDQEHTMAWSSYGPQASAAILENSTFTSSCRCDVVNVTFFFRRATLMVAHTIFIALNLGCATGERMTDTSHPATKPCKRKRGVGRCFSTCTRSSGAVVCCRPVGDQSSGTASSRSSHAATSSFRIFHEAGRDSAVSFMSWGARLTTSTPP